MEYETMLEIQNNEIFLLRRELHHAYGSMMILFFDKIDYENALNYYLALPNDSRKCRTSFEMIMECCRVAKTHREQSR